MQRRIAKVAPKTIARTYASIGILVWNEEKAIRPALESLFQQSFFDRLALQNLRCEIICVTNGCTDRTPQVASEVFAQRAPLQRGISSAQVVDVPERGKLNAWNLFVHRLSAKEAAYLFLMDGDIVLQHPDTLWNMCMALENDSRATIAAGDHLKDIEFKPNKSLWDRISLATSRMTETCDAQFSGQLYCIQSAVARNIYLPKDLVACEDGFLKVIACTYFLTREPCDSRIIEADNASHIFQAYTSPGDIIKNQKRQMIGQTIVHLLVDQHLKNWPLEQKLNFAETLQEWERADPHWLKRLVGEHLRRTKYFWQLFPGILTYRFQLWWQTNGIKKLWYLPATIVGFVVSVISSWMAWRFLRRGYIDYWPDTQSSRLKDFVPGVKMPGPGSLVTIHCKTD
jgi:glycosyltransferase involved in cell wall biosynthesis